MAEMLARDVVADPGTGLGASLDRFAGRLNARMGGFGFARTPTEGGLTRRVLDRWTLPDRFGGLSVFDADALGALDRNWGESYDGYYGTEFGNEGSYVIPVDPVAHPTGAPAQQLSRRRRPSLFQTVNPSPRAGSARPPRMRERWRPADDAADTLSPYPAAMGRAGAIDSTLLRFPDARATMTSGQRSNAPQQGRRPLRVLTATPSAGGWGVQGEQLTPAAAAAEATATRLETPFTETTPVATWLVAAEASPETRLQLAQRDATRRAITQVGDWSARAVPTAAPMVSALERASDLGDLVAPTALAPTPRVTAAPAAETASPRPSLFAPRPTEATPAARLASPVARSPQANAARPSALVDGPATPTMQPGVPFTPAALGGLLREAATTAPTPPLRRVVRGPWASPPAEASSAVVGAPRLQPFAPPALRAAQRAEAQANAPAAAAVRFDAAPGALIEPTSLNEGPGAKAAVGLATAQNAGRASTRRALFEAPPTLGAAGPERPGGAADASSLEAPAQQQTIARTLPEQGGRPAHAPQASDAIARALSRVGEGAPVVEPVTSAAMQWRAPVAPPTAVSGAAATLIEQSASLGRFLAGLRGPALAEEGTGGGTFFGFDAVGTLVEMARAEQAVRAAVESPAAPTSRRPSLFAAKPERPLPAATATATPRLAVERDTLTVTTPAAAQAVAAPAELGATPALAAPPSITPDAAVWIEALAALAPGRGPDAVLAPRGSTGRLAAFVESVTSPLAPEAWLPAASAAAAQSAAEHQSTSEAPGPGLGFADAPMGAAGALVAPAVADGGEGQPSAPAVTAPRRRTPSLFATPERPGGRAERGPRRVRRRRATPTLGSAGARATAFAARVDAGPQPAPVAQRPFVEGAPGALIAPTPMAAPQPAAQPPVDEAPAAKTSLFEPKAQIGTARAERHPAPAERRAALGRLPAALARMLAATEDALEPGNPVFEQLVRMGIVPAPTPGEAPASGPSTVFDGAPGALIAPAAERPEAGAPDPLRAEASTPQRTTPMAAVQPPAARAAALPGRAGVQALGFSQSTLAVFRARLFQNQPALAAAARGFAQRAESGASTTSAPAFGSMVGPVISAASRAARPAGLSTGLAAPTSTARPAVADWVPGVFRDVVGGTPALVEAMAAAPKAAPLTQAGRASAGVRSEAGAFVMPTAAPTSSVAPNAAGRGPTFGRPTLAPRNVDHALVAFTKAAQAEAARGGTSAAANAAGLPAGFGGPIGELFAPGEQPRPTMARMATPTARPSIRLPGGLFGDRGPSISVGPGGAQASRVMIETGARMATEQALRSTPGQRPQQGAETAEEARHRNADQSEDSLSPEEIERIARDIITMLEREAEFDLDRLGEDYD